MLIAMMIHIIPPTIGGGTVPQIFHFTQGILASRFGCIICVFPVKNFCVHRARVVTELYLFFSRRTNVQARPELLASCRATTIVLDVWKTNGAREVTFEE